MSQYMAWPTADGVWHLLFRVTDDERPLVYDRLSSLVAPPSGVTRQGTLALNSQMMDSWWNAFDFGDISIWRYWEQNQAPAAFKKASRKHSERAYRLDI